MKSSDDMKPVLLCAAAAALWCADLSAQEPTQDASTPPAESVATDTAVQGYRFVKMRANGDMYIDYRAMGEEARDDERFAALTERFIAADKELEVEDVQVLYYGRAFRDDYTGRDVAVRGVYELLKSGLYDSAYAKCLELQRSDPASPQLLRLMYEAAWKKSIPLTEPELSALEQRYGFVLTVISFSGNGTMLAPYVVTAVGDEYELMYNRLEVTEVQMQSLVILDDGTRCDVIKVGEGEGADSESDEVWFNVDMLFGASDK